jgi:uncharacterized protein YraI
MRFLIVSTIGVLLSASAAMAIPATTTANVNFRSGPGTSFASMGTVPSGSQVDMGECDDGGTWCTVTVNGQSGFMSGQYLQADDDQSAWPRAYTTDSGATIVLHQPQITGWDNFTDITAQVAAEYKATEADDPVFGVIGLAAKTQADHENNEVVIDDIKVTELSFSVLGRDQLSDLALEVGKLMPTGSITMSMQRLTASLASYEQLGDVDGLKSDAPPIFVSEVPAILVQTEGEAVTAPVEAVDGLSFVVNTNWDLFQVASDSAYYLRDDTSWLTSASLTGDWQAVTTLPDVFAKLPDDDNWKDARAAMPPTAFADGQVPKVVYVDKPSELILFDGPPKLEAVPGTGLEWASNTESDVFFLTSSKTWYLLVSGRWFSGQSLQGPWTFASTDLPDDFRRIPDNVPYYTVRASVPGTSESEEARLKGMIPQTARVATDGSVTADVTYSGDPNFTPIEGTALAYADNTESQVIQVGDKYYVLQDGIWFVGDTPNGPWSVSASVPDPIYDIPPSSPVYNVTYVRVYDTEPDAVWFGYTAGYLGAYLAWNTFVYGTGWYYPPYWGWYGPRRYPIYYPRPITYGIGAYYNPVRGAYGRYGYAYGPYRGIGRATYYSPRTGTIVRAGGSYGPLGERGFVAAYNPATGRGGVIAGGNNIYGSWGGAAGITRGTDWARQRGTAIAGGAGSQWRTPINNAAFSGGRRPGDNVFAGRDGNVYRQNNGQWQQRVGNNWAPAQGGGALANRPQTLPAQGGGKLNLPQNRPAAQPAATRPNLPQKPQFQAPANLPARPSINVPQTSNLPSNLRADQFGRQFGNQMAIQQRSYSRPSTPRMPSGGFSGGSSFRGGGGGGGFRGGGGGGGFHRR